MNESEWVEMQKETILRDVRVGGIDHAIYLAMDAINLRISRGDKELLGMNLSSVRRCIKWMVAFEPKLTKEEIEEIFVPGFLPAKPKTRRRTKPVSKPAKP